MSTNEETKVEKKSSVGKIIAAVIVSLVLVAGAAIGFFLFQQNARYLRLDNARVTTDLVPISATAAGSLNKNNNFAVGQVVAANSVLATVGTEQIRTPIAGLVVAATPVDGQMLFPGEPIGVIADLDRIHVEAHVRETDVSRFRVGQVVDVTVDALGSNRVIRGYVDSIGQITAAELSGQPVFFNTAGDITRVTQLLPIQIRLSGDTGSLANFIGGNARVTIPLSAR